MAIDIAPLEDQLGAVFQYGEDCCSREEALFFNRSKGQVTPVSAATVYSKIRLRKFYPIYFKG
jgi:hypothetical protein